MNSSTKLIYNGPRLSPKQVVLAHGAGAGMESPFMEYFAHGLASHNIRVVRFEFPYMARRKISGKNKPPDREPVLRSCWQEVIARLGNENLVIGGKSMGGRIASLVADEAGVAGLVCLGYPFHPTGKPDKLRTEHLLNLKTPTLILQGERDAFGNRAEVAGYRLPPTLNFQWLEDGNHGFKPRKLSGRSEIKNWDQAVSAIVDFVARLES